MSLDRLAAAGAEGRCRALWKFEDSPDVRQMLNDVRRHGPGRLRRAALDEVAAAISLDVGWHRPVSADVSGWPLLASVPGTGLTTLPAGVYEI
ncbi:hypothetical protein [Dactylosporangium sp. NPDC006015]|uniref:hypothetical protein n=1 Tax=Dactylosporangium sp. NPDC006015 TaxID=3154576 RepID=UPI0033B6118B